MNDPRAPPTLRGFETNTRLRKAGKNVANDISMIHTAQQETRNKLSTLNKHYKQKLSLIRINDRDREISSFTTVEFPRQIIGFTTSSSQKVKEFLAHALGQG